LTHPVRLSALAALEPEAGLAAADPRVPPPQASGDPWMMTVAVALIITVAAIAISVPARRATQIDPMLALRCE
jgi:hypothetical protein